MRSSGKCPKCGNANIAIATPRWSGSTAGNIINEYIPLGMMSGAMLNHYICCNCGYLEHYIQNLADLKKISEKFKT